MSCRLDSLRQVHGRQVHGLDLKTLGRSQPPKGLAAAADCLTAQSVDFSQTPVQNGDRLAVGRQGLLKYYSNPTKYTPDQYLQTRIDAAKRVLDMRNRRLAFPFVGSAGYTGMSAMKDFGFVGRKGRWYGEKGTKWGAAYDPRYPYSSGAWYQWQLVYGVKLARGKIDADAAARGGRGLESVAAMTHLDSWDVLGEWGMATHEMENYFDVPLEKK